MTDDDDDGIPINNRRALVNEAKAFTMLAFRAGPVESIHAGKTCEACDGDERISHITDEEMRILNKYMVDKVYELLMLREHAPKKYARRIREALMFVPSSWDDPERL